MSETNTDSVTSDLSEGATTPPPQPSSEMTPTVAVAPTPTPTTVAPVVTPVVAPKPTPQETYDAQLVAVLKERLEQYKKHLMVPIASHVTQKSAAQTLDAVVQSVLSRPIPDVFEVVWDFFVVNATGVCHEGWALQGVDALDKQRRFKVEIFYTLFRMAMKGVDVGDPTKATSQFVAKLNAPKLILFLQGKAKIISTLAAQASA